MNALMTTPRVDADVNVNVDVNVDAPRVMLISSRKPSVGCHRLHGNLVVMEKQPVSILVDGLRDDATYDLQVLYPNGKVVGHDGPSSVLTHTPDCVGYSAMELARAGPLYIKSGEAAKHGEPVRDTRHGRKQTKTYVNPCENTFMVRLMETTPRGQRAAHIMFTVVKSRCPDTINWIVDGEAASETVVPVSPHAEDLGLTGTSKCHPHFGIIAPGDRKRQYRVSLSVPPSFDVACAVGRNRKATLRVRSVTRNIAYTPRGSDLIPHWAENVMVFVGSGLYRLSTTGYLEIPVSVLRSGQVALTATMPTPLLEVRVSVDDVDAAKHLTFIPRNPYETTKCPPTMSQRLSAVKPEPRVGGGGGGGGGDGYGSRAAVHRETVKRESRHRGRGRGGVGRGGVKVELPVQIESGPYGAYTAPPADAVAHVQSGVPGGSAPDGVDLLDHEFRRMGSDLDLDLSSDSILSDTASFGFPSSYDDSLTCSQTDSLSETATAVSSVESDLFPSPTSADTVWTGASVASMTTEIDSSEIAMAAQPLSIPKYRKRRLSAGGDRIKRMRASDDLNEDLNEHLSVVETGKVGAAAAEADEDIPFPLSGPSAPDVDELKVEGAFADFAHSEDWDGLADDFEWASGSQPAMPFEEFF